MAKEKLYNTYIRAISKEEYQVYIAIDHQQMFLVPSETEDEANWIQRQVEIALDRLIQKAKEQ